MIDILSLHVGDRLCVLPVARGHRNFVWSMEDYVDSVVTVDKIDNHQHKIKIVEDNGIFWWYPEMFEYVEENDDDIPQIEDDQDVLLFLLNQKEINGGIEYDRS